MSFFTALGLILKYLPLLMEIAVELEKSVEEGILNFQINKANDKIDVVFKSKDPASVKAGALNDIFRK